MESPEAITALASLAQDTRLAIFRLLVRAGRDGLPAGEIAQALDMAPSSLSFHLAQLTRSAMVSQERQSRQLIYRADFAAMNRLVDFLLENCCQGEVCEVDAPLNERSC